jgi:hypothetical protein
MLARAFEFYEYAVSKGFLREYGISGTSSFSGEFKKTKSGHDYPIQQLSEVSRIAEKVGGRNHHFKHVHTPFSMFAQAPLLEKL